MARPCVIKPNKLICVGAGGHAQSVLGCILESFDDIDVALIDNDKKKHNSHIFGVGIIGDDTLIPELVNNGFNSFLITVGVIKPSPTRQHIYKNLLDLNLNPYTFISPYAYVSSHAQIGHGSVIMPNVAINAGAIIGDNCIVNTGCVIEHDAIVKDHCHIAPGAVICGAASVDKNSYIGANAVVNQTLRIGRDTIVGSGAVVTKDIGSNKSVKGIPAL